ncbi:hypothetical protein ILQ36_07540 [Escherichia coli O157:H7]|nr:hypothetical protein ILQ36_07540 [Escherichia coli O157:H7]
MLPSETMIWQPEFTDKTLSRKPGAVHHALRTYFSQKSIGGWGFAVVQGIVDNHCSNTSLPCIRDRHMLKSYGHCVFQSGVLCHQRREISLKLCNTAHSINICVFQPLNFIQ